MERELGQGANGTVYLVTYQGRPYALKLSDDSFSISSEVNVLKHFEKAQGTTLGPSVYDVDDWQDGGGTTRSFYVMNVIEGLSLLSFVKQRGQEWISVFMLQLLDFLEELHQQGWVFGDLKPENLKVSGHPPRIAWFDAGGITKLGRAIKEYTQVYDRGYWQMGNRKAEASYDLFSIAIIFLYLHTGRTLQPQANPKEELQEFVFQNQRLYPYQQLIWNALSGKYGTAQEMKKDLLQAWYVQKGKKKKEQKKQSNRTVPVKTVVKKKKGSFLGNVISFFFISSFLIFLFALYLFSQTL